MANRKPVNVSQFVLVHNICMALLSLWMLVATLKAVITLDLMHAPLQPLVSSDWYHQVAAALHVSHPFLKTVQPTTFEMGNM